MPHFVIRSAIVLLALIALPSQAQPAWPEFLDVDLTYRASAPLQAGQRWDVRLGAGVEREPTYQGSDDAEVEADAFALLAYRRDWGNVFVTGGGLGFSRLFAERVGVAVQLEAEDTREEGDDPILAGLGDQDQELELEMIAQYLLGPWQFGGSLAVATGDKGVVWFVGGSHTWRVAGGRGFVSVGGDLSGSNADNQRTDFGITPGQSAASLAGLPPYVPDGGLKSFGLRLAADYRLSERWFAYGALDYERLLGDVADSPLVIQGSENNVEAEIGVYYRF